MRSLFRKRPAPSNSLKLKIILLAAAAILLAATPARAQESVCSFLSHLSQGDDGSRVVLTGELDISRDSAALGASVCDTPYVTHGDSHSTEWATALSLRPSPDITPEKLQQFRAARAKADQLRQAGKVVSASGSFSGRLRMATSEGSYPGELIFDSFENLKVEALPDSANLQVIPICDLFQSLDEFKSKRIAVRGEFVSTMEGAWISGRCKGGFYTNGYRWPVALDFVTSAFSGSPEWPQMAKNSENLAGRYSVARTATFVGVLRMRQEYSAVCRPDGTYFANGFGHMNGAAAELVVDSILNLEISPSPASDTDDDSDSERCTPPNLPALCAGLHSLAEAARTGCVEKVREYLAKDGIDVQDGSESRALDDAIRSDSETVVKMLLKAGAPLNPERPVLQPPLFEAASLRRIAILRLLLAFGAKADGLDSMGTTYVASYGVFDPQILKILLDAGANPDATDEEGQSALMMAADAGYEESVKILLAHHAQVNLSDREGRTALMHACAGRFVDAILLLLEHGADLSARDNQGKTALDLAQASKNLPAIKLLSATNK